MFSKLSFVDVNHQFHCQKFRFTATRDIDPTMLKSVKALKKQGWQKSGKYSGKYWEFPENTGIYWEIP